MSVSSMKFATPQRLTRVYIHFNLVNPREYIAELSRLCEMFNVLSSMKVNEDMVLYIL